MRKHVGTVYKHLRHTSPLLLAPRAAHPMQIEAAYPLLGIDNPRKARAMCAELYAAMMQNVPRYNPFNRINRVQAEILTYLTQVEDQGGICPTVREIAIALHHRDHYRVQRAIVVLQGLGLLSKRSGRRRSLRVLVRPEQVIKT